MDEWQKIVAATAAGFFGGILAEPFKQLIRDHFGRRRIKAAINDSAFEVVMEMIELLHPQGYGEVLVSSQAKLRHYIEKETSLFWQVKGSSEIMHIIKTKDGMSSGDKQTAAEIVMYMLLVTDKPMHNPFSRLLKKRLRKEYTIALPELKKLCPQYFAPDR